MPGNLRWKALLIAIATIVAFVYLSSSITDQLPEWWPKKQIKLGLDLQGGTHLLLEVETGKAVENTVERITGDLKDTLRKKRIRYSRLDRVNDTEILVELLRAEDRDEFKQVLNSEFRNLKELFTEEDSGKLSARFRLSDKEIDYIEKFAVDQGLQTIRNRIDQFGVSEPMIQKQGEKNILVQLPGIKDIKRAKNLIGKTAPLRIQVSR
ncbi:MAG: hypothetical protein ABID54_05235 [Pseudomonadota bacterium]